MASSMLWQSPGSVSLAQHLGSQRCNSTIDLHFRNRSTPGMEVNSTISDNTNNRSRSIDLCSSKKNSTPGAVRTAMHLGSCRRSNELNTFQLLSVGDTAQSREDIFNKYLRTSLSRNTGPYQGRQSSYQNRPAMRRTESQTYTSESSNSYNFNVRTMQSESSAAAVLNSQIDSPIIQLRPQRSAPHTREVFLPRQDISILNCNERYTGYRTASAPAVPLALVPASAPAPDSAPALVPARVPARAPVPALVPAPATSQATAPAPAPVLAPVPVRAPITAPDSASALALDSQANNEAGATSAGQVRLSQHLGRVHRVESLWDALERARQTGEAVRFVEAVSADCEEEEANEGDYNSEAANHSSVNDHRPRPAPPAYSDLMNTWEWVSAADVQQCIQWELDTKRLQESLTYFMCQPYP